MTEGNNHPAVFFLSGHQKHTYLLVTARCSFLHTEPKLEITPAPFWNGFVLPVHTRSPKPSPKSPKQMYHNYLFTAYMSHHQPPHLHAGSSCWKDFLWRNRKVSVTAEWSFAKETTTNVPDFCLISALSVRSPCPSRRWLPSHLGRNRGSSVWPPVPAGTGCAGGVNSSNWKRA